MISKTRRYAILLVGTIFIGTAPHLADGLGWLVQGTSRITEETANRALVWHGQLISSPSPRQSAAGTDATQPAGIFRLHLATRFASCVTRTTSGKAILDIARAMQRQFDDLPGFAPLHRIGIKDRGPILRPNRDGPLAWSWALSSRPGGAGGQPGPPPTLCPSENAIAATIRRSREPFRMMPGVRLCVSTWSDAPLDSGERSPKSGHQVHVND